jgi:DNA-binding PadR family transcriptional regulator
MGVAAARKTAGRAMTSPVNWVLLGLVIERPSYGLELATRFERMYGDVLAVSSDSHVYKAIDALYRRGMIEEVPRSRFGRQPKPHYRATELGQSSFEDWWIDYAAAESRRQKLWVRQLRILGRDPRVALRVLTRFELEFQKKASQIGMPPGRVGVDARGDLIDELVSEHQRSAVGGVFSWLGYAQRRFEALAAREPAVRKPPDEPA